MSLLDWWVCATVELLVLCVFAATMSSMLHLRATADVSAGAYEVVANGSPETGEVSWLHLAAWVVGAAGAALLAAFAAFMCGGGDDSDRMDDDDSFEVRCVHVCVRKPACTPHEFALARAGSNSPGLCHRMTTRGRRRGSQSAPSVVRPRLATWMTTHRSSIATAAGLSGMKARVVRPPPTARTSACFVA